MNPDKFSTNDAKRSVTPTPLQFDSCTFGNPLLQISLQAIDTSLRFFCEKQIGKVDLECFLRGHQANAISLFKHRFGQSVITHILGSPTLLCAVALLNGIC